MRRVATLILLLGTSLLAAEVDFSGTYTADGSKGTVKLAIRQAADGTVTGTMIGGDASLAVTGKVVGGQLMGSIRMEGTQSGVYLMARREGKQLQVMLAEPDADGKPNEATSRRIAFTLADENGAPSPPKDSTPATTDSPGSDAWAGTYRDDENRLVVELNGAGGEYTGTIRLGDDAFPLKASAKAGRMEGAFQNKQDSFEFTATTDGKTLTLKTGNSTYALQKQLPKADNPLDRKSPPKGPPNPLDRKPADKGADAGARADAPVARFRIYRHPTGGSFGYPEGWTVKEGDEGLLLVPPAGKDGKPAEELYFISTEAAPGIRRPDDPAIIQLVEAEVAQLAGFLKRKGDVEQLKAGSQPGAAVTWEGTHPTTGVAIRGRLYVTLLEGSAVYIVALGTRDAILAREPVIRDIFGTFSWGKAQREAGLVGTWHYWHYSSSGLGGPGLSSTETRRMMALGEDGTARLEGNVESYISAKSGDASAQQAGNRGSGVRGTWASGDGRLYLKLEDDSYIIYRYEIRGSAGNRQLILQGGGDKPETWTEKRVEI